MTRITRDLGISQHGLGIFGGWSCTEFGPEDLEPQARSATTEGTMNHPAYIKFQCFS